MNTSHPSLKRKRTYPLYVLTICLAVILLASGFKPISTSHNSLALRGYDTVAYFTENRAVKGSAYFTHEWNGAVWRFRNRDNLETFKADPAKYAPQFGGYCSFGMARGKAVSCDPQAFIILDGKLYVMKNKHMVDIIREDPESFLERARESWQNLIRDYQSKKEINGRQDGNT